MKSIMVQLKCPDCGQVFDTGKLACPTCGCPADACTMFDPNPPKTEKVVNEKRTTNTGDANERSIVTYANVWFWVMILIGIFAWIICIAAGQVGGFLLGGIVFAIQILLANVGKSFIRIIANISINLHELNMKIQ